MNDFEQHVLPQPLISFFGKLFVVCFCYCLFHIVLALASGVFLIILSDNHYDVDTRLMLLIPHVKFFNYGGKGCRPYLQMLSEYLL